MRTKLLHVALTVAVLLGASIATTTEAQEPKPFETPHAELYWSAQQWYQDLVFTMTYPAPAMKLLESCIVLYEGHWGQGDYSEFEHQCKTPPTNGIADFFTWKDTDYKTLPFNVLGYVKYIGVDGIVHTDWAFPIPTKDS